MPTSLSKGWRAFAGLALGMLVAVTVAPLPRAEAENLNRVLRPAWNCTTIGTGQPGHCGPGRSIGDRGVRAAQATQYADPDNSLRPPSINNSPDGYNLWGAIAAGLSQGSTNHVSVGAAWNEHSRVLAEEYAMAKCQTEYVNCHIVGTFNSGCGFVTVGHNDNGGVGWGSGPTAQRAYDNCQSQGLECKTHTIGGCIEE